MAEETQNKDIDGLSFEAALSELDGIVGKLEAGNASLEESIDIYSRGTALKQHCESKLKAAQAKIEKITLSESGAPAGAEPLDTE